MPANITIHTNRTLYDEWNERYTNTSARIKELRETLKITTNPEKQDEIDSEIQELCIQANLIHQFLADVGVMVYVEEQKQKRSSSLA